MDLVKYSFNAQKKDPWEERKSRLTVQVMAEIKSFSFGFSSHTV